MQMPTPHGAFWYKGLPQTQQTHLLLELIKQRSSLLNHELGIWTQDATLPRRSCRLLQLRQARPGALHRGEYCAGHCCVLMGF